MSRPPDYLIFGASRAMLAMLLELLRSLAETPLSVTVVKNIEVDDGPKPLPWIPADVRAREVMHHESGWDRGAPALLGVNSPTIKRAVQAFFAQRYGIGAERYARIADRAAAIASSAELGAGCTVGVASVIGPFTRIGDFVTTNRGVHLGHHITVGEFATLGPRCTVGGRTRIGAGVTLGINATVFDGLEIGAGTVIGAGSVVTRSLPPGVVAYGVPARIAREIETEDPA